MRSPGQLSNSIALVRKFVVATEQEIISAATWRHSGCKTPFNDSLPTVNGPFNIAERLGPQIQVGIALNLAAIISAFSVFTPVGRGKQFSALSLLLGLVADSSVQSRLLQPLPKSFLVVTGFYLCRPPEDATKKTSTWIWSSLADFSLEDKTVLKGKVMVTIIF